MRLSVVASTGVGMFLAVATGPLFGRASSTPDYTPLVPSFMSAAVDGNCGDCGGNCVWPWHQVKAFEGFGIGYVGLHDSCEYCTCGNTHGTCQVTLESSRDAARYFYVVRTAPPYKIESMIESLGSKVHLNLKRQSVQVDGCNGTIAVNIPLTQEQITALQLSH